MLEQLYYKNNQGKTPLHIAVAANNTRMVNLILKFMAKLSNSGITVMKDIFSELIDYQDFATYLEASPFQTVQMINKPTLCLPGAEDSEIVLVRPSRCSYVDDVYFQNVMGENTEHPKNLTFSVNIKCVRADWILTGDIGLGFMQNLLKKRNRSIFMTPYMKIIV